MFFFQNLQGVFRSYQGRHFISRWARKLFEGEKVRKWLGYHLATATFVVAVVNPSGTTSALAVTAVPSVEPLPLITNSEVKTETTFSWPVINPSITQGFFHGHPGIDIQGETSIHPIDRGWVSEVNYGRWGYGNHVYVQHPNGRKSLYAHLNSVSVSKGQDVTRDTVLGVMGRTGWATGIHLHLEIYQDGVTLNPLAVLPTK
jgi:murein DD-endopeptidase MepM/ murein hydrolase activator NlpD